jgi:hypothetical protein
VPSDEPHEYQDDCWCLPEWDDWVESFGAGAHLHNTIDGRLR